MAAKTAHHTVSVWYAHRLLTGPLARDAAADAQAVAAKDDLVKRLEKGGKPADAVNAWFGAEIAAGAIARNTEAYNHAFAAKGALIQLLGGEPAPEANVVRAPAKPKAAKAKPARSAPASDAANPEPETPAP